MHTALKDMHAKLTCVYFVYLMSNESNTKVAVRGAGGRVQCTPSQLMDLLGCSGGHTQGRHMCLELKPSRPVTSLHPVMHPAPHSPGSLPPLTQSKSGPNFILHPYEDTSISNLQSSTATSNTDTISSTAFTEGTWRGALELEGGGLHRQMQHTLYLHGASACHTAFRQHNL